MAPPTPPPSRPSRPHLAVVPTILPRHCCRHARRSPSRGRGSQLRGQYYHRPHPFPRLPGRLVSAHRIALPWLHPDSECLPCFFSLPYSLPLSGCSPPSSSFPHRFLHVPLIVCPLPHVGHLIRFHVPAPGLARLAPGGKGGGERNWIPAGPGNLRPVRRRICFACLTRFDKLQVAGSSRGPTGAEAGRPRRSLPGTCAQGRTPLPPCVLEFAPWGRWVSKASWRTQLLAQGGPACSQRVLLGICRYLLRGICRLLSTKCKILNKLVAR